MTDALKRLSEEGVAIWLDDLSRKRITSGNLAELIDQQHVVGVTTNPSIFQKAISSGDGYEQQLADLAARKVTVDEAIRMITTADCPRTPLTSCARSSTRRRARTAGSPSRSTRASPTTPARPSPRPKQLAWLVDRPNTLIKIPLTKAGLAITEVIGRGISVDVTLIFSLERYREVMDAYLTGLEKAKAAGLDLSKIHSVASFFVSRVDTEISERLDALGTPEAKAARGKAALADALAYEAYEEVFSSDCWAALDKAQAEQAAPAVGVDRRQGPGVQGHPDVDRAGGARRRTPCRRPPCMPPRTTATSPATPSPVRTSSRVPSSMRSRSSGSRTTTWSSFWRTRASRSSRRPGTTC